MKICEDNGENRKRTGEQKEEEESVEIKNVKWGKLKEKDSEKGVRNELSPTPFKSFCRMICGKITTDYASRIFLMMSSTVSLYLVSCFMFLTTCPVA